MHIKKLCFFAHVFALATVSGCRDADPPIAPPMASSAPRSSVPRPTIASSQIKPPELPRIEDAITHIRPLIGADETITMKSGASFTAPKGFSIVTQKTAAYVRGPRREVSLTFVEISGESDAERASDAAWKQVNPNFAQAVKRVIDLPARDGWDAAAKIEYMPIVERSIDIWVIARRKGSTWYLAQFYGFRDAWARWGPAIDFVYSSLKVPGVKEESFRGKTAHALDAPRLRSIDSFVKEAISSFKIPGAAVAIVQGGKIVFEKGYGVQEMGLKDPVTPKTLFRIASMTKPLTSAMMAELVDEGKFTWDTPVLKLFPRFRAISPAVTQKLNLWHTMCACTGLPRQDLDALFEYAGKTPESLFEQLKALQATTGFEETFQYSSQMVAAGGYIAAHAAYPDESLDAAYKKVMATRIFEPLGMSATTLDSDAARRAEHARGHARLINYKVAPLAPTADDFEDSYLMPAGGGWSNVRDISNYLLMELGKGKTPDGKQIISEKNLLARHEPRIHSGGNEDYGLALYLEEQHGIRVIWHDGGLVGYSSEMFFLPDHGVGAVILSNLGASHTWHGAFERRLLELLFGGREEARADLAFGAKRDEASFKEGLDRIDLQPGSAWVEPLVGTYTNPFLGEVRIRIEGNWGIFSAGEWESPLARSKATGGNFGLVLLAPGKLPIYLQPFSHEGKTALMLEMLQRQYIFEPLKAGGKP